MLWTVPKQITPSGLLCGSLNTAGLSSSSHGWNHNHDKTTKAMRRRNMRQISLHSPTPEGSMWDVTLANFGWPNLSGILLLRLRVLLRRLWCRPAQRRLSAQRFCPDTWWPCAPGLCGTPLLAACSISIQGAAHSIGSLSLGEDFVLSPADKLHKQPCR